MKSFIKERWLSLVIAVVIVALTAAVVIFIMAMLGFRITYAPELENDWEAISAVASWVGAFISCVGVLASFLAIWYAIQVPKTIADRQDQIALFEKRYIAYSSLLKVLSFSRAINQKPYNENTPDENGDIWTTASKVQLCCFQFATVFGYHPRPLPGQLNSQSISQTIAVLNKYETEIEMLPFLFEWSDNEKEEIIKEISNIFKPLYSFMNNIVSYTFDDDFKIDNDNRQKFICVIHEFLKKYAERFERELKI